MKLTKTTVEQLPTPSEAPASYRDDELHGFGVKVFTSGARSLFLEKRVTGRVKRITIRFGEPTAEQARKEAVKLAGRIATGAIPSPRRHIRSLRGLPYGKPSIPTYSGAP